MILKYQNRKTKLKKTCPHYDSNPGPQWSQAGDLTTAPVHYRLTVQNQLLSYILQKLGQVPGFGQLNLGNIPAIAGKTKLAQFPGIAGKSP